jgi:hypothetical protein
MNNKNQQYRQGDVLLECIPSLPKKLTKLARENGQLILAHGSATGHSHAVSTPRCDLHTSAAEPGVVFLEVRAAKAQLTHNEHATIVLPKGIYRVSRQSEYSPGAIRQMQD